MQVDIDTLQKFADTLDTRIDEASLMLRHAAATDHSLPLGTFGKALEAAGLHADAKSAYTSQVQALHAAMVKARDATQRILTNYRTVDEQNHAMVEAIHKAMSIVQPLRVEG